MTLYNIEKGASVSFPETMFPTVTISKRCAMTKSRRALNRAVIMLAVIFMILTASVIIVLSTDTAQYYHNMNLGKRYLEHREYASAVRAYDAAIGIRTESAEAYMGRGDAYAGIGEKEQAVNDYETARALDPSLDKRIERRLDDLLPTREQDILERASA